MSKWISEEKWKEIQIISSKSKPLLFLGTIVPISVYLCKCYTSQREIQNHLHLLQHTGHGIIIHGALYVLHIFMHLWVVSSIGSYASGRPRLWLTLMFFCGFHYPSYAELEYDWYLWLPVPPKYRKEEVNISGLRGMVRKMGRNRQVLVAKKRKKMFCTIRFVLKLK